MEINNGKTVVSQFTENAPRTQIQQPKTVTFCCNILEPKGPNLATQGNRSVKNEDDYASVKIQRNRIRSAQRAYEQQAYSRLRELVPTLRSKRKKSSKLETLKHACVYINHLKDVLEKLQAIKMEREQAKKGEEASNSAGIAIDEVKTSKDKECT